MSGYIYRLIRVAVGEVQGSITIGQITSIELTAVHHQSEVRVTAIIALESSTVSKCTENARQLMRHMYAEACEKRRIKKLCHDRVCENIAHLYCKTCEIWFQDSNVKAGNEKGNHHLKHSSELREQALRALLDECSINRSVERTLSDQLEMTCSDVNDLRKIMRLARDSNSSSRRDTCRDYECK